MLFKTQGLLYPAVGAFPQRDYFVSGAFYCTAFMVGFTLWGMGLLCTHKVNRWEFLCEIKLFGLVRWTAKKRTRITNKLLIRWNASCGDINDALASLFDDQGFIDDLAEIYSLQNEAETLIKDLAKHPKSFDEEYSDFKECYNLFVRFTDMSLTAEGSLNSFTDDHNELDKEIADKLKELDIYFD